jgi:hypothetical protein
MKAPLAAVIALTLLAAGRSVALSNDPAGG